MLDALQQVQRNCGRLRSLREHRGTVSHYIRLGGIMGGWMLCRSLETLWEAEGSQEALGHCGRLRGGTMENWMFSSSLGGTVGG